MKAKIFSASGAKRAFWKEAAMLGIVAILVFSHREGFSLQSQHLSLSQMTAQAGRIVVGHVLSSVDHSIPAPGGGSIPITQYTISVSDTLKGKHAKTIVVRHVRMENKLFIVGKGKGASAKSEFPSYKADEDVVLFLTAESALGLSSPVGLTQGVFRVTKDVEGKPVSLVNGLGNAGLLEGMSSKSMKLRKGGPASYTEFVSVVKEIVKHQQGGLKQ